MLQGYVIRGQSDGMKKALVVLLMQLTPGDLSQACRSIITLLPGQRGQDKQSRVMTIILQQYMQLM